MSVPAPLVASTVIVPLCAPTLGHRKRTVTAWLPDDSENAPPLTTWKVAGSLDTAVKLRAPPPTWVTSKMAVGPDAPTPTTVAGNVSDPVDTEMIGVVGALAPLTA